MAKCSLCGEKIDKGTGKRFVKVDGTSYYFCSTKCERNFNMGRKPTKLNWVKKKK